MLILGKGQGNKADFNLNMDSQDMIIIEIRFDWLGKASLCFFTELSLLLVFVSDR